MKASTLKIILKNWLLQRRTLGGYLATNTIYRKTDMVVASGPFQGLQYTENSTGGAYFPKLLGIYEKELNEVIARYEKKNFEEIINVGAAEGYFSVGFALKFKSAKVISYEPGFYGCYLMQKMAEKNGVYENMEIRAQLCMLEDLKKAIDPNKKTLIFMDVEGAELDLLQPEMIPALKNCHILVEIHDMVSPSLGNTIKDRFLKTHNVEEIWQQERTIEDMTVNTFMKFILKKQFEKLMDEGRSHKMRWFAFEPK